MRMIMRGARLATLGIALLGVAFADDGGPARATVGTLGGYENVLIDGRDFALYLFTNDTPGTSTCYDQCAAAWPPLLGDGLQGDGIDADLVGTTQRSDGTSQVTYGGWPLYRFTPDTAGTTEGQGRNDVWFLVSASGEAVAVAEVAEKAEAEAAPAEPAGPTFEALMAEGQTIFANICSACHGAEGQGGLGVTLAGNPNLSRPLTIIGPVLWGDSRNIMPAFGGQFSDEQVAAVATFVRNSWSNDFGAVSPEEVRNRRQ